MLLKQFERREDSRARCTAGSKSAIRQPTIAITTSSSTSVNARTQRRRMLSLHVPRQEVPQLAVVAYGCELPYALFPPTYAPRLGSPGRYTRPGLKRSSDRRYRPAHSRRHIIRTRTPTML